MILRPALILVLVLQPAASCCQTAPGAIPAGTPLALMTDQNYPMRAGAVIRAHLLYPIYADNQLLLPKGTIVTGNVVSLHPNRSRRINAMLGGDFTPFRIPDVHFTQLVLAGGAAVPLSSALATNGTPIYRAVSPPPSKGGILRQEFNSGLTAVRGDVSAFTAPGKLDRLLQWFYGRIPYHPQRIEKGTSWTVETTAALDMPAQPAAPPAAPGPPPRKTRFWELPSSPAQSPSSDTGAWIVQADLAAELSSETSRTGQPIRAVVAEPIFNPDHTIAVPQGATLVGAVTKAKPARHFGRTGVLSFSFKQLILPNAETQTVETRLTGADTAADIVLSSEGQAKAKPQDKIAIPLFLAVLAGRPLDQDCGHRGGCSSTNGKNSLGGAAGLGLVGTVVSLAGGSANVAAGIGYYGAARAVYARWIARGQKIDFAKDTRIVVETTPRRAAPIKPNTPPTP